MTEMSEMQQPRIVETSITSGGGGVFHVTGTWAVDGVVLDRPQSSGYAVRGQRLAERIAKAMRDGKVFENAQVRTDVNGHTYVSATATILGRTANADLRRLGY